MEFTKNESPKKIAEVILPQFPDISKNSLTTIIDRYKKNDSWLENPFISEESFKNLENIMIDANLIEDYVPYNKLINNLYEK